MVGIKINFIILFLALVMLVGGSMADSSANVTATACICPHEFLNDSANCTAWCENRSIDHGDSRLPG